MRRLHQRAAGLPRTLLLASVLAGSACGAASPPSESEDRYPLAAAQAVDAQALESARATLATHPRTRCLVVERNGVVVMEEYFNGAGPSDFFDVRSVTKSVTALLVGIALERGSLRGLDQTVGELLGPSVPGIPPAAQAISLRDLLTMTSGLPWRELGSVEQDYAAWVGSADPLLWILGQPLDHPRGTYWHYNTGASHVVSAILGVATGQSARSFAQEALFGPLGTTVGPWPADPRGYNYGGHGISLQAGTLVKLGRLLLDGGAFQGRQLVPAAWVREATTAHNSTNHAMTWGQGYGYFFWTDSEPRTGRGYYFATGYGGQFVVNIPQANATVVATTAWNGVENAGENWTLVMRTIVETVLPGLR